MLYTPEEGAGLAFSIPLGFHHPQASANSQSDPSPPPPHHVYHILLETHCLGCFWFLIPPGVIHIGGVGLQAILSHPALGAAALGSLSTGLGQAAGSRASAPQTW